LQKHDGTLLEWFVSFISIILHVCTIPIGTVYQLYDLPVLLPEFYPVVERLPLSPPHRDVDYMGRENLELHVLVLHPWSFIKLLIEVC